ncbi:MAG: diacylglycerol kinase [Nitrospiraceae bacterium]|nr:diacylglycerol kinase [Nitrospiraceae bacterium]
MSSLNDWFRSAGFAIEGILHAAKTQRHLRYHFYAAFFVLFLSFLLGVSRTEFLVISVSVILVLLAEMLNTAIEATVDIISPELNEKARIAKDIAAGTVLITSCGVAVVGVIILYPYMEGLFASGFRIARHSGPDTALLAIVFVLIAVVLLKARFAVGRTLSGGMPSGHAALAFSAWVSITYLTGNFMASALGFILAFAVARSRTRRKIHKPIEVIAGGALGAVITFFFFRLFS